MSKRTYRDIEVRGVVFETVQAVAAHFGVDPATVRLAIRRGTLHRLGTGRVGLEPMPVRIRGRVFETARAAAAHFDVTPQTIYTAIREGREDRIGLRQRYPGRPPCRVEIGGYGFASRAALSRALGRPASYVSSVLTRGGRRAREDLVGQVMRLAAAREAAE